MIDRHCDTGAAGFRQGRRHCFRWWHNTPTRVKYSCSATPTVRPSSTASAPGTLHFYSRSRSRSVAQGRNERQSCSRSTPCTATATETPWWRWLGRWARRVTRGRAAASSALPTLPRLAAVIDARAQSCGRTRRHGRTILPATLSGSCATATCASRSSARKPPSYRIACADAEPAVGWRKKRPIFCTIRWSHADRKASGSRTCSASWPTGLLEGPTPSPNRAPRPATSRPQRHADLPGL